MAHGQDYSWVPWFKELVGKIFDGGPNYLAERASAVEWATTAPRILAYRKERIEPFSFLYYLASCATSKRLLRVYGSVHDKFDMQGELPQACTDNNLIIPVPPSHAMMLFHDGAAPFPTDLAWSLFRYAADFGAANESRMSKDFADVLRIRNVGVSKLTQTLFLIDPDIFLCVDRDIMGAMSNYLEIDFKRATKLIEQQDGYARYKEIVDRIRRAFPGCEGYEINTFLWRHARERFVGPDRRMFQISTNVYNDNRDRWSVRSLGGADERRTFNEHHCAYVGGPGDERKYPLEDPERGDIVLVRYGRNQGRAVGVVERNEYKDKGGFHEDAAIHVFWINKTATDSLGNLPQIGFSRARGAEAVFCAANEYGISFDLLDKIGGAAAEDPWTDHPDLTETALAENYPEMLGPGKWDAKLGGGPPPGPREFWIADRLGFTRPKTAVRFMMAMFARKGLGAAPEHYINVWRRPGTSQQPALSEFLKFDAESGQQRKETPPDGFRVKRMPDGHYRVIWLQDDAVDGKEASRFNGLRQRVPPTGPLNVILYGPPGTGKTYTTREHCVAICDGATFGLSEEGIRDRYDKLVAEGRVGFVTFHQSYGYEEFIEGLRPRVGKGAAGFRLKATNGILKRIAERARAAGDAPHVLVIDEINRANVSKVMGELVTLLEEDKREGAENEIGVTLPHSHERFTLPRNLHILGTMNTADRSIALLDTALRRRFAFEELAPDPSKLANVGGVDLPGVLRAINERLEWLLDRDCLIGHAWFMRSRDRAGVDRVMRNKIVPLIAEYFYDDWSKVRAVLGGGDDFVRRERLGPPPGLGDETGDDRYRWTICDEFEDDAYERLIAGAGPARADGS